MPDTLEVLDAPDHDELAYLSSNLHNAQLMKGLAAVQLQKAIKIFRTRIRDLKVHELLYNQALSNLPQDDEASSKMVQALDQKARAKSLSCEFMILARVLVNL